MLPKSKRLTKQDFTITRPKIFFRGELFDLAFCVLTTQKVGCVISKKTLKKATDRNFVRRRFYSLFLDIKVPKNYSIIVYPKKNSLTYSYKELQGILTQALTILR
jgi:ribonuclease P protein component